MYCLSFLVFVFVFTHNFQHGYLFNVEVLKKLIKSGSFVFVFCFSVSVKIVYVFHRKKIPRKIFCRNEQIKCVCRLFADIINE
jgi:hypothetical protein